MIKILDYFWNPIINTIEILWKIPVIIFIYLYRLRIDKKELEKTYFDNKYYSFTLNSYTNFIKTNYRDIFKVLFYFLLLWIVYKFISILGLIRIVELILHCK